MTQESKKKRQEELEDWVTYSDDEPEARKRDKRPLKRENSPVYLGAFDPNESAPVRPLKTEHSPVHLGDIAHGKPTPQQPPNVDELEWQDRIDGIRPRPTRLQTVYEQAAMFPKHNRTPTGLPIYSGSEERGCANCGRLDHRAKDCIGPVDESGSIFACPIHNTRLHSYDECFHSALGHGRDTPVLVRRLLIGPRVGKPPLASSVNFTEHLESRDRQEIPSMDIGRDDDSSERSHHLQLEGPWVPTEDQACEACEA